MTAKELILKLTGAAGVAGCEEQAVQAARELLAPYGSCELTPLGSLVCRVKSAGPEKPHLMLTAHIDQIGMVVTHIDEKGFLRVGNCGGIDRSMLLSSQLLVHTASGLLPGVVCTIPPHLNPDENKIPKMEEFAVDVGLSAEDARRRISLGDRITFDAVPAQLAGGKLCSPAADDRAGCASVILAAQALAACPLDCSLSVLLASMEETGGAGARTGANLLSPTHAIAVDVSFGDTPDTPKHQCGVLGKGPMVGIAPILDQGMFSGMKACAERHGIPYQVEVMSRSTGTDADSIAVSGAGVRCALLSIPLRYMHTPIELIEPSDVQLTADLIAAYVKDTFGGNADAV